MPLPWRYCSPKLSHRNILCMNIVPFKISQDMTRHEIDGSVQDYDISSASALEIPQSCTDPPRYQRSPLIAMSNVIYENTSCLINNWPLCLGVSGGVGGRFLHFLVLHEALGLLNEGLDVLGRLLLLLLLLLTSLLPVRLLRWINRIYRVFDRLTGVIDEAVLVVVCVRLTVVVTGIVKHALLV